MDFDFYNDNVQSIIPTITRKKIDSHKSNVATQRSLLTANESIAQVNKYIMSTMT